MLAVLENYIKGITTEESYLSLFHFPGQVFFPVLVTIFGP